MTGASVGASYARGLFELAASKGADRRLLADRAGIDPGALEDHDNRIPFANYMALMRAAKEITGEPALALHFGEAFDLSELSILGLICHASETMLDAFRQMNRYGQIVVEADNQGAADRFELRRHNGHLWIVDNRVMPPGFPELVETTFALMICGTRQFGETPFVREVHVSHADPGYGAAYERVFRAPVRFGASWNAMRIDEAWLNHKIALQPRYVFGVLTAHADTLLRRIEAGRTVRSQVESLLMPILHTGDATMEMVANKLGVSRQTLYRRLKAENVTFEQVLDGLRRELALHYLHSGRVSVNETAYLVGFSDPAAFSRAFKRWTGQSPRAARAAGHQQARQTP
jgi:AraC-like DNA-binding protein